VLTAGLGRTLAMRPCSYEGELSATVLPMSLHASFVKVLHYEGVRLTGIAPEQKVNARGGAPCARIEFE